MNDTAAFEKLLRQKTKEEVLEFVGTSNNAELKSIALGYLIIAAYNERNPEAMNPLVKQYADLTAQIGDNVHKAQLNRFLGLQCIVVNNLSKAIDYLKEGLSYSKDVNAVDLTATLLNTSGAVFNELNMHDKALVSFKEAYELKTDDEFKNAVKAFNLGIALSRVKQYDEGAKYLQEAQEEAAKVGNKHFEATVLQTRGGIYRENEELSEAYKCFERSMALFIAINDDNGIAKTHLEMGTLAITKGELGEAKQQLQQSLAFYEKHDDLAFLEVLHNNLSRMYEMAGDFENALTHFKQKTKYDQQVKDEKAIKKAQSFEHQFELERREKEFEVRLANARLQTLTKIASDIAHEVQNPLQFVNNFSEVNIDLVEELTVYNADKDTEGVTEVAADLKDNSHKIRDYGIRISKIVDQLLEQTRKAETGELEVDDTNPHNFSK